MICFSKQIFTKRKISHRLEELEELVALLDATYIFFCVFDISARSWCCDTTKMCYIFRQICPFHSELRKDKIATCLLLPPHFFCHLPLFGRHVTSPEPGSFFPRMKDPGNEVDIKLQFYPISHTVAWCGTFVSASDRNTLALSRPRGSPLTSKIVWR